VSRPRPVPAVIRLGPLLIEVREVKDVLAAIKRDGAWQADQQTDMLLGWADIAGSRIYLETGMSPEMRRFILLHETAHFVEYLLDLDMTEAQANFLASLLEDVSEIE